MNKKFIAACGTLLALAFGLAHAGEAEIRKSLDSLYGSRAPIDAVRKAGVLGLYEVQMGTDVLYSDEKGSYFIQGDIIDVKAKKNLTEARKNILMQVKFSDLPLDLAVKTVRGSGRRIFATFEDPNCGYCKKLAKDMVAMTDFTMYTFMIPILSADSSTKSKAIWCSADRAKAWSDWMINNTAPTAASCDTPIEKILALGQKLGVRGTPTIILSNGERIPGAVPAAQLEKDLDRVAAAK